MNCRHSRRRSANTVTTDGAYVISVCGAINDLSEDSMGLFFRHRPRPQPPSKPPERIVITGLGTVTPQAGSTWESALALRIRKTAWCAHETVLLPDDPDCIHLRGATVSRVPEHLIPPELDGAQRAAALLSPALKECIADLSPKEMRCLECRIDNFVHQQRDDLHHLLQERFPLLDLAQKAVETDTKEALGTAAFFDRIMQAAEELRAGGERYGRPQYIVVGCVDSLCATSWLMAVRDEGILKDALTPDGIIAGEAAGAVLLERESHARRRNAPALAVLSSWGRGTEYNSWFGVPPATGKGLTEGFQAAFSGLEDGGKAIATIVADLNGERHRALDWAYTEGRIFHDTERERELRHPAFLTGDCGGATGAVMLADALGRLAFHPSFRGGIALTASDESGARRVLCLERGDRADRRAFIREIRTRKGSR